MAGIEDIAAYGSEVTLEEVNRAFHQEIDEFNQDLSIQMAEIRTLINSLIINMENYQHEIKLLSSSPEDKPITVAKKLELKKNLIYKDFFKLQNLMNLFIYQKIVMTYVHVDEVTGRREIRLFNNDIDHLNVTQVNNYGRSYTKLAYEIGEHYLKLKNSLEDFKNEGLQDTANQVTLRYEKYKGRILWRMNTEWVGYKLSNRGPINEAFVDFYIKEVELNNSLNDNIDVFMTSTNPQGVIRADNANGFLIGDVSMGGIQFAVKGAFGSPQNFTTIITWLKQIQESNFSHQSLMNFINRFKDQEQEQATRLVKPMLQRSIKGMVNYHQEHLLDRLEKVGDTIKLVGKL